MAPEILISWWSYLCSPLLHWIGWAVTKRILQKCVTSSVRAWRTLPLLPCSLLDHLLWGKSDIMLLGSPSSHNGKVYVKRNCALLPAGGTNLPAMWGYHLGSGPYHPSHAFRWLQPSWHLDCSLLRDPKPEPLCWVAPKFLTLRNCEIIKVYWYFKMLTWGVIFLCFHRTNVVLHQ